MGMLIYAHKVYEDDGLVAYAFDWPDGAESGTVAVAKSDPERHLTVPSSDLDPISAKIIGKAYRESTSTGSWPTKVLFAS